MDLIRLQRLQFGEARENQCDKRISILYTSISLENPPKVDIAGLELHQEARIEDNYPLVRHPA
jgi:hypothetical protein